MRRVVVTGMGIQSCIGTDLETVKQSLYNTTSGIKANPEYTERGMRSQISGSLALDTDRIDRKLMRFMGNAAAFAYLSAVDAWRIQAKRRANQQHSHRHRGRFRRCSAPAKSKRLTFCVTKVCAVLAPIA